MTCHLYILYSRKLDKYYLGHTYDTLEKRIGKHNSRHKGFTSRAADWGLVYFEQYPKKQMAYAREREVKAWKSRDREVGLIGKGT